MKELNSKPNVTKCPSCGTELDFASKPEDSSFPENTGTFFKSCPRCKVIYIGESCCLTGRITKPLRFLRRLPDRN